MPNKYVISGFTGSHGTLARRPYLIINLRSQLSFGEMPLDLSKKMLCPPFFAHENGQQLQTDRLENYSSLGRVGKATVSSATRTGLPFTLCRA
jgi:hypothetical protein